MMKVCEGCQKEFKAFTKYKRFCDECYSKRQEEHVKRWVEEHKKPNAKCVICGAEITNGRRNRKYCDNCLFGDEGSKPSIIKVDVPLKEEPIKRVCGKCGKDISSLHKKAKYCFDCRGFVSHHRKEGVYHKPREVRSKEYTFIFIDQQGKSKTFKAREQ